MLGSMHVLQYKNVLTRLLIFALTEAVAIVTVRAGPIRAVCLENEVSSADTCFCC